MDISEYSVWLSAVPITLDGNGVPIPTPDSKFFYLGSNLSISFNVEYRSRVLNITGNATKNAIFVDSTGGAKGNISISGVRVHPFDYDDGAGWSPGHPIIDSHNFNKISNLKFIRTLIWMKERMQMKENAYTLRIYRGYKHNNPPTQDCAEFPVFVRDLQFRYDAYKPDIVKFDIALFRRHEKKGFNLKKKE